MRGLRIVATVAVLLGTGLEGQAVSPCVRIAFGAWAPPLDWYGAGHADSTARVAARVRHLRDSVFAGSSPGGRDEMVWSESGGQHRLLLFPAWWPAGVLITFPDGSLGDTLSGDAQALVADLSRSPSRARARVVRRSCT